MFGKLKVEYRNDFPTLIDRSQFNLRRRKLIWQIEKVRTNMAEAIVSKENIFIIDSMPLEVCKISRSKRSKICKESYETLPDKGYCSAQKSYFYGYKLHGLCTFGGVLTSIDMTKASLHDIHYLQEQISNAYLLGDKAYLSNDIQIDLFTSSKISLQVPTRINQHNHKKQPFVLRKARKRIETLFSQLCDLIHLEKWEKMQLQFVLLIEIIKLELLEPDIGGKENRYMRKKIKYSNEEIGKVEIVKDFLPKPEDLVFKEDTVKVTLNLSKSSIEFFKEIAQKHGSQYQKVIRNLLDRYTSHYSQ